ncbi:hypothetical protein K501DRAFT_200148 [Backusella circina FSU 941]|nr:hypothetical protein K501DRAFT_200148 [Backusella circina FSU 941]
MNLGIWRVSMPHSKLYIKNCIGSVEVPTTARTSEKMSPFTLIHEGMLFIIEHFDDMFITNTFY